jgi:UDP-N-acetylmuramate--alanine ligase
MGTGAQWTGGEWFVVEADESDGTHLELPLFGTILTNVEHDHLDHYGTFDAVVDAFDRYLAQVPRPEGGVRRRSDPALDGGPTPRGHHLRPRSRRARRASRGPGARRGIVPIRDRDRRGSGGRGVAAAPGVHNVQNATGAFALAVAIGVAPEVAAAALARSSGVWPGDSTCVAPTAAPRSWTTTPTCPARSPPCSRPPATAATTGERVVAVFQPNRYHRIAEMWAEYADAFVGCRRGGAHGRVRIGHHSDPGRHRQTHRERGPRRTPREHESCGSRDVRTWCRSWPARSEDGDVCISMGCGDVATLPSEVLDVRRR